MITYPFCPSCLKRSWNDTNSYQLDVLSTRKNGGVETRSTGVSPNITDDSWNLNLVIDSQANKNIIDNFLLERNGKPFWFEARLYKASDFSWSWDALGFWKLSLKLEHAHRNYTGI